MGEVIKMEGQDNRAAELADKIEDVIIDFVEAEKVSLSFILGVLETLKLNLFRDAVNDSIEFEFE